MTTKLSMRKEGLYLVPLTQADAEELGHYDNGTVVNASLTSKRARSIQMHKMYFGGLLPLGMDYWEPEGGLLSKAEKDFAKGLVAYIESQGHSAAAVRMVMRMYMQDLKNTRKEQVNTAYKDIDMFHDWVKQQTSFVDYVMTPDGIIKKAESISFDSMSHERWMKFYKQAFNVIWNLCLSKAFESKEECQKVIDQLCSMG